MLFFDIAAYWHRVYALYVEAILRYGGPSINAANQLHDAHTCYLGNWIGAAGTCHAGISEFQALKRCHDTFHDLTDRALFDVSANRSSPAWLTHTANDLRDASFKVIHAIARLNSVLHPVDGTIAAGDVCPIAKYKVGVPIIDEQHEALAAIARRLAGSPFDKLTHQENAELISELAALTALHFDTEEIYMQCIQLPPLELEKHRIEHKRILGRLFAISANAENLNQLNITELVPQFNHWFKDHLIDFDYSLKKY